MSENTEKTLHIDIVSDVVCPWCVIGYRQLAEALAQKNVPGTIHWHPFELNPGMGDEGEDLTEHITRKYGITEQESAANRQRLMALGESLDFKIVFDETSRIYPTHRAHQLLAWARDSTTDNDEQTPDDHSNGDKDDLGHILEHKLKLAMFEAYFSNGKNINDTDTLMALAAPIVTQAGLNTPDALAALNEERYAESVRTHRQVWTSQGIQGVPAMIFNRKYLVSGAQGVERYLEILDQLENE